MLWSFELHKLPGTALDAGAIVRCWLAPREPASGEERTRAQCLSRRRAGAQGWGQDGLRFRFGGDGAAGP